MKSNINLAKKKSITRKAWQSSDVAYDEPDDEMWLQGSYTNEEYIQEMSTMNKYYEFGELVREPMSIITLLYSNSRREKGKQL